VRQEKKRKKIIMITGEKRGVVLFATQEKWKFGRKEESSLERG